LLIVYRQATISLAGLAIDPANFLFSLHRSPAVRWRSEMTGNKIRVLTQ
jgi:hypothetical protein